MNKKYAFVDTISHRKFKDRLPISGTGPFTITSFNVLLNLKVQRNNEYWGDKSALPYLNFVPIKSSHSRVYALIAGDVAISEDVEYDVMPAIVAAHYLKIVRLLPVHSYFLTMNSNHAPAFTEQGARDGLALAINQHGIVKYMLKGYARVGTPWLIKNKHHPFAASNYDLVQSQALLKKNKVNNYLSLLVMGNKSSAMQSMTEALFVMLHRAGITLISKTVQTEAQWDKNKEKFDLFLRVWKSNFVVKANWYHSLFYKSSLSGVLLKNFSTKNALPSVEEYVYQMNRVIENENIIPLFSTFTFFALRREFNSDKVFSVNGIPYWSNLRFNKTTKKKEHNDN